MSFLLLLLTEASPYTLTPTACPRVERLRASSGSASRSGRFIHAAGRDPHEITADLAAVHQRILRAHPEEWLVLRRF